MKSKLTWLCTQMSIVSGEQIMIDDVVSKI